ncbi:MAG: hypothetical protein Q7J22_01085 [Candidatus Wolfebacteria bacterium]|nr:hypothetical protein [Candidatus Wolfebacteria bacterium]
MSNPLQQTPPPNAQFAPASSFRSVGLPWRLLVFSGFLFGFAVFVFLGLKFGYGTYLDARTASAQNNLEKLAASVGSGELDRLVGFYSQLVNIENVLRGHSFSVNVFSFLESNTIPSVYWTSASFSGEGLGLELKGKGRAVSDVVDQLAVFDKEPHVNSVALKDMSFDGFEVNFGVSLKLKKDFFEKLF